MRGFFHSDIGKTGQFGAGAYILFLLPLAACVALAAQLGHGLDGGGAGPIWNVLLIVVLLSIAVSQFVAAQSPRHHHGKIILFGALAQLVLFSLLHGAPFSADALQYTLLINILLVAGMLLAIFCALGSSIYSREGHLPRESAGLRSPPDNSLVVISPGAVFMCANSCIGNARNLMVKSIAERNSVRMPGFFGYKGWPVLLLGSIFGTVTPIFFT